MRQLDIYILNFLKEKEKNVSETINKIFDKYGDLIGEIDKTKHKITGISLKYYNYKKIQNIKRKCYYIGIFISIIKLLKQLQLENIIHPNFLCDKCHKEFYNYVFIVNEKAELVCFNCLSNLKELYMNDNYKIIRIN